MAILSKIRDRSMFLILIVGLALFAFVLDPSSIQNFFSASKVNSVGQVNGEDIDREEFARQVEAYRTQSGNRATQMQAVNAVWNSIVAEKIFEKQLKEAGIVIGEKDIWDAMISLPEIQNSVLFKNEANLFDEEKLKEYIANMQDEAQAGNNEAWLNWIATERSIKQNLERQAYTELVSAGLGASLAEGQRDYLFNNTQMNGRLVYVPYSTVADSLGYVSREEINDYLNKNKNRYKTEATRTLQFVHFDIIASDLDDADIKNEVLQFINDREEYSNAAKTTVTVSGLKNATDYEAFINENKSDLGLDSGYKYKAQVNAEIADSVFSGNLNDVFGPYKENGYYKISKLIDVVTIPDSVKSSHILVPYTGATRSFSTKTKEQAKKTADSIYRLVRNSKDKFTEIADSINTDGTKGKGGDIGWVRKDQAFSPSFDERFADFIYKNKTGAIDVVETAFGYHIIRVDDQNAAEKAVKLATFSRAIEPSELTENAIFEEAETIAARLADGSTLEELTADTELTIQNALNLKVMDENIPGLGAQRQIVTWAFDPERVVGDSRRFDVDVFGKRGYVVIVLNSMTDKDGVAISSDLLAEIRPELINKKKAEIIKKTMTGTTLEEIAQNSNTNVRSVSSVTLASPLISGVGNEPGVVGAMSTLPIDQVSDFILGEKGVFVVTVTERKYPVDLDNYDVFRKTIATQLKGRTFQIFQVLEETADIEDNRSIFF
jgi:peptidylprolyl isomerase/peptidyl-prolyl cis-trans isomerase D